MNVNSAVSDDLYALANMPNPIIHSYPGCMVNGVRYHTKNRDERRTTQNHGVCVEVEVDDATKDFYGVIDDIWEVSYLYWNKVIVFKCSWFDTSKNASVKKEYNYNSIRVDHLFFEDEPYALADQARQVFYVDDIKNGDSWKVVQKVNHRHLLPNAIKQINVDDCTEEDNIDDAYQEEVSHEVDVTFDTTNVEEAPLNRTDIDPIEIDGLFIDLQFDLDDDIVYNSDIVETDEETTDREFETSDDSDGDDS